MERIVHSAVSISKPKPTEINVTKPTPNLVTEVIVIEKPRHIEVVVSKGLVGVNGADQRRRNKILENRISELEKQVSDMLQILQSLKGAN